MTTTQAITYDDKFFTGKDASFNFTVLDDDGDPVDISTYALRWILVRYPVVEAAASWLVSKTTVSGITITDGPAGECTVTVDDDNTTTLQGSNSPRYWHQLERTDAGLEDLLSCGPVVLRQSASL